MAAEPSQFLNEMPLELIEDLSSGSSWLSFARGSINTEARAAVAALRGETRPEKPKNLYTGKTYNSADAVAEFFKSRGSEPQRRGDAEKGENKGPLPDYSALERLKASGLTPQQKAERSAAGGSLAPGSYVRHEKYGRGLVLRREGSGDNAKLTVSFPGFGQKKLIEKYANLQKVQ